MIEHLVPAFHIGAWPRSYPRSLLGWRTVLPLLCVSVLTVLRFGLSADRCTKGPVVQVPPRAGSLAGRTSLAHADRFQSGTGVGQLTLGTNREHSTRRYLWM